MTGLYEVEAAALDGTRHVWRGEAPSHAGAVAQCEAEFAALGDAEAAAGAIYHSSPARTYRADLSTREERPQCHQVPRLVAASAASAEAQARELAAILFDAPVRVQLVRL